MAQSYSLQPNEAVLIKEDGVMHGGFFAAYSDELMLTNLNLVVTKKGVFGNPKGLLVFPLNQVKVYEQQAQAIIGKAPNGGDLLEVYFLNGQENFRFQSGGKKKLIEWVAKINQAVTGQPATTQQNGSMALPGADLVAGVLKDTVGVFRSKFGSKAVAPVTIAAKCGACGAPISGTQGQTATCQYCGSAQQL